MNIIEEIASLLENEGINAPDSNALAEKIYEVLANTRQEGFQITYVFRARQRFSIRKLLAEYKVNNIPEVLDQIENLDK